MADLDPAVVAGIGQAFADITTFSNGLTACRLGTATAVITSPAGQPAPGWYPVVVPGGVLTWEPSPAKLYADALAAANGCQTRFVQLASGSSYTLDPINDNGLYLDLVGPTATTNVTVNIPNGLPANWRCSVIQAGTGTGRITFAVPSGGTTTLINRQSAFRTAGQGGVGSLLCTRKASSGASTIYLFGDLVI